MADQEYPVELFVYDLSSGMARQLSVPLTGRLIEGIWHTSIVYNSSMEIFYGQGISITQPGGSHHGQPLERHKLGMTSIDPDTLGALVEDLKEKYVASAYHLLDFNCNTFTEELSQILTGNSIPSHISSLPADFLSTPFGQMLRPQIDAMFRPSGTPSAPTYSDGSSGGIANGLLGQVAISAYSNGVGGSAGGSSSVQSISNNSQLDSLIKNYPCVAILYTSESCPPCKIVQPVFAELAAKHSTNATGRNKRIAFARVDSSPSASGIMSARRITATPTVQVWTKGVVREIKGADIGEIKTQIELSLFEAYPPHPHSKISGELKSMRLVPRNPILVSASPNLKGLLSKLDSFISATPTSNFNEKADLQDARKSISTLIVPALEKRFSDNSTAKTLSLSSSDLQAWSKATETLLKSLPTASLFPLLDLFRLAVVDEPVAKQLSSIKMGDQQLTTRIISHINTERTKVNNQNGSASSSLKSTLLTSLKLLTNILASASQRSSFLGSGSATSDATALIVAGLLSDDKAVRAAGANAAFNAVLHAGEGRIEWLDEDNVDGNVGPEWEAEIASALVEALNQERESDETIHRLSASLFHLLHLSSSWLEHLQPLLEVLDCSEILAQCLSSKVVKESKKSQELITLLKDSKTLCEAA